MTETAAYLKATLDDLATERNKARKRVADLTEQLSEANRALLELEDAYERLKPVAKRRQWRSN